MVDTSSTARPATLVVLGNVPNSNWDSRFALFYLQ